jgi:transposase-like protein
MGHKRTFTAEFKTQVVLDIITGKQSNAEVCRQYNLKPQLVSRWQSEFLERAAVVFGGDKQQEAAAARIAELERLVGQLSLELAVAKKGLTLFPVSGNGRRP